MTRITKEDIDLTIEELRKNPELVVILRAAMVVGIEEPMIDAIAKLGDLLHDGVVSPDDEEVHGYMQGYLAALGLRMPDASERQDDLRHAHMIMVAAQKYHVPEGGL